MVKICAEIGVNWNPKRRSFFNRHPDFLQDAKEMICEAKTAGADMAKFQLYNYDTIRDVSDAKLHQKLVDRMFVDEFLMEELVNYGKEKEITVFFSCMYPEGMEILERIGVDAIKIREKEGSQVMEEKSEGRKIIDLAMATGKQLYISSQKLPTDTLYLYGGYDNIVWVRCWPMYPPQEEEVNLADLQGWNGYSNHLPGKLGVWACIHAATFDMEYIEIHVTRAYWNNDIDINVSMSFEDLEDVVQGIKSLEKMNAVRKKSDQYLM